MSITVRELMQLPHLQMSLLAGQAASTAKSPGCTPRTWPTRGSGTAGASCS